MGHNFLTSGPVRWSLKIRPIPNNFEGYLINFQIKEIFFIYIKTWTLRLLQELLGSKRLN